MYESSCSYQSEVKKVPSSPLNSIIKTEEFAFAQNSSDWSSYRFHQSTFEQLKQSVEKAKAALQDRTFLGASSYNSAFSDLYTTQRNETHENSSSTTLSNNIHNNTNDGNGNSSSQANGSAQSNTIHHNHSHNIGMPSQRLNLNTALPQTHEASAESPKSRQQSKYLSTYIRSREKISKVEKRTKKCTAGGKANLSLINT